MCGTAVMPIISHPSESQKEKPTVFPFVVVVVISFVRIFQTHRYVYTNNRTEKSTATIWWVRDVHKLGLLVKKKGRRRYILDFRSERPIGTSPPGTCVYVLTYRTFAQHFQTQQMTFFFSWIGEKLARTGSVFSSLQHLDFVILKLFFFYSSTSLL